MRFMTFIGGEKALYSLAASSECFCCYRVKSLGSLDLDAPLLVSLSDLRFFSLRAFFRLSRSKCDVTLYDSVGLPILILLDVASLFDYPLTMSLIDDCGVYSVGDLELDSCAAVLT